jgi:hypothetical protein
MAVTAQNGVLSFGGQSAKDTLAATFYQHRAADIDLGIQSDDRLGPPEVGGIATPTIPYRAGVMAAGGATINPRLEDTLGWLLFGGIGAVVSTADENVFGTVDTGYVHHTFTLPTVSTALPYMSFRKHIPSEDGGADDLGEVYQNCKIVSFATMLPNDGLIQSRVDVLGTAEGTQFEDPSAWSYGNTEMEDYQSIPIGSTVGGYLKVPDYSAVALPITQARVIMSNPPLPPAQEKNFGSPYLDAVTIASRQLAVDMVLKWKDQDLFRSIYSGSTTATQWISSCFIEDLDIYTLSPNVVPSLLSPYALRIEAPEVQYRVAGIGLSGQDAIMMRIMGIAIAPSSGEYCTFHLGNEVTSYTWPT